MPKKQPKKHRNRRDSQDLDIGLQYKLHSQTVEAILSKQEELKRQLRVVSTSKAIRYSTGRICIALILTSCLTDITNDSEKVKSMIIGAFLLSIISSLFFFYKNFKKGFTKAD